MDGDGRRLTGTQRSFSKGQIERYIESIAQDVTRVQFGIVTQHDHQLIGDTAIMNLHQVNRNGSFRIAIMDDSALGKGYGSEATSLMLDYGFGMLNLHRIQLDVYTINERAIHVYEKLGFKREGILREEYFYDHKYYDSIIISILEHEYRALRKS